MYLSMSPCALSSTHAELVRIIQVRLALQIDMQKPALDRLGNSSLVIDLSSANLQQPPPHPFQWLLVPPHQKVRRGTIERDDPFRFGNARDEEEPQGGTAIGVDRLGEVVQRVLRHRACLPRVLTPREVLQISVLRWDRFEKNGGDDGHFYRL